MNDRPAARPEPDDEVPEVLDVVGVGFGPSNLALAIAITEHNETVPETERLSSFFVERQERFGWHRGMLLEDATMRISFLKDLATLRDPTSSFSFLNYLHERDRLVDFINYGATMPTRLEFHDYLEWAAARFAGQVEYGSEVVEIRPGRSSDGVVEHFEVISRLTGGGSRRLRARNVALATGLTPHLPPGVTPGRRIWHNHNLLHRMPELAGATPERLVVVGAGQSAAEVLDYLHRTFPSAEVCALFARYGYSPADDSSFANRVFDPAAVDEFFAAPETVKQLILDYHGNTNYSVVDPDLITSLFRRHYHEKVAGKPRLRFRNVSRITDVVELADRVELAVESLLDGNREVVTADLVVYATGYRGSDSLTLLDDELSAAFQRDAHGRPLLCRDYRVSAEPSVRAGLYLQGSTEHSHGISSTLLSNTAVRAGEMVASMLAARQTAVPAREQPRSRLSPTH